MCKMVKIEEIEKGSIAENLGIKPGSYLVSIDGREINDSLDLHFFESDDILDLLISLDDEENIYHIEKDPEVTLGIKPSEFKTRLCTNKCTFCFIDQNPPDVRESLLIKDGDYRLSFLYGNYITMTNLTNKDFDRILELKLSPLYISVHTTDLEKRVELLRNPKAGRILEDIDRLVSGGITLHTQIVLLPDVNDKEYFHETIEDLLSLFPGISSVGIVPVGLTNLRSSLPDIRPPDSPWMDEIIGIVEPYQEEMRKKVGNTVIYLADEFYIKTGNKIPPEVHYDEFPQLENGIGMTRRFLDGLKYLKIPNFDGRVLLVTGTLAAGIIWELVNYFKESNIKVDLLPVSNRYFGDSVEVAGLLGGWDLLGIISMLEFDVVILPPDIVNSDSFFIDGCPLKTFQDSLPMEVYIAPYDIRKLEDLK